MVGFSVALFPAILRHLSRCNSGEQLSVTSQCDDDDDDDDDDGGGDDDDDDDDDNDEVQYK